MSPDAETQQSSSPCKTDVSATAAWRKCRRKSVLLLDLNIKGESDHEIHQRVRPAASCTGTDIAGVQGGYVYIPAREHKSWGEKSGSREALAQRNEEIRSQKQAGATLEALAETYHLSVSAIRKIIYQKEK